MCGGGVGMKVHAKEGEEDIGRRRGRRGEREMREKSERERESEEREEFISHYLDMICFNIYTFHLFECAKSISRCVLIEKCPLRQYKTITVPNQYVNMIVLVLDIYLTRVSHIDILIHTALLFYIQ